MGCFTRYWQQQILPLEHGCRAILGSDELMSVPIVPTNDVEFIRVEVDQ